jgi:hypothetical protein
MAYYGSKGWFVQELKKLGIYRHPVDLRKIETYRTAVLRSLYFKYKDTQPAG